MRYNSLPSYPRRVIRCAMDVSTYFQANLDTSDIGGAKLLATICFQAVNNARECLDMWSLSQALVEEFLQLEALVELPLTIDTATAAFLTARATAVRAAATALQAALPKTLAVDAAILSGLPPVPPPGLYAWLAGGFTEAPPAGLSIGGLAAAAQAGAAAWSTIGAAMTAQIASPSGAALNTCALMGQCAQIAATDVASVVLSPALAPASAWNTLVFTPAVTCFARSLAADPTSEPAQELNAARYALLTISKTLAILLSTIAQSVNVSAVTQVAQVRYGDSLRDIAARELGDHEQWYAIALLNGLRTPFISAGGLPNTVAPGGKLYLPSATQAQSSLSLAQSPSSYELNFLGVDIYLGPVYGSMPPWTGDFLTISGYANLRLSLGRRVLTTTGSLVYHSTYGSRVPPQVGAIVSQSTSGHLAEYLMSALLSDPRVDEVPVLTFVYNPDQTATMTATVVPAASLSYRELTVSGNDTGAYEIVQTMSLSGVGAG